MLSPTVTEAVNSHFQRHAPIAGARLWFEHNNTPLKWSFPVGVLFDSFDYSGRQDKLPWKITVHYFQFPDGDILSFKNPEAVRACFQNQVKESCYLRYGNTSVASKIERDDWLKAWDGLISFNPESVLEVHDSVDDPDIYKSYAVRVLLCTGAGKFRVVRKPISTEHKSLKAALISILPDILFESKATKVVIQGVTPDLESPMMLLSRNMCAPDMFLYVCIWFDESESVLCAFEESE